MRNDGRFVWSRSTSDALDDCLWLEHAKDGRVLLHCTQKVTLEPAFHPSAVSGANMEHVSDLLQTGALHERHLYVVSVLRVSSSKFNRKHEVHLITFSYHSDRDVRHSESRGTKCLRKRW